MKIGKKIIYVTLICICSIYFFLFFSNSKVKYDLTDCVRYFDDYGRYRLMLVADTYFFVDAEREYGQKSNIIQYYYNDNVFYGICLYNEKTTYFVFDIKTGKEKEYSDANQLTRKYANVFSSNNMIQLDKPNKYERYFRKFIPLKYRKK